MTLSITHESCHSAMIHNQDSFRSVYIRRSITAVGGPVLVGSGGLGTLSCIAPPLPVVGAASCMAHLVRRSDFDHAAHDKPAFALVHFTTYSRGRAPVPLSVTLLTGSRTHSAKRRAFSGVSFGPFLPVNGGIRNCRRIFHPDHSPVKSYLFSRRSISICAISRTEMIRPAGLFSSCRPALNVQCVIGRWRAMFVAPCAGFASKQEPCRPPSCSPQQLT